VKTAGHRAAIAGVRRQAHALRQEDVAVTVRSPRWLAAALGLFLLQPLAGLAAEPAPLAPASPPSNQQMADAIAGRLRQSDQLHHYAIDVTFADGIATVSGRVAGPDQRDEALRLVREMPGVVRVVSRLEVAGEGAPVLQRVQAEVPGRLPQALPGAPAVPPPTAIGPGLPPPQEAVPSFQAPPPAAQDLNPPRMPPYAWPTYAPFNNYSRVAQPLAYPYNAFPFIGPSYPFPKIPPGWRAIKLEWDDGYWWYSKLAPKYDWWRLRFY
jgi:hypothetical protein